MGYKKTNWRLRLTWLVEQRTGKQITGKRQTSEGPLKRGEELWVDPSESWFFIIRSNTWAQISAPLTHSGPVFGTSMNSGSLHYAEWHSVKTHSHSTASDLSDPERSNPDLQKVCIWRDPLAFSCEGKTTQSCCLRHIWERFQTKGKLVNDWTGSYRPWCSCLAYSQLQRAAKTLHIAAGVMWREKVVFRQKSFSIKAFLNLLQESKNTKHPSVGLSKFQSVCNFVSILSIGQEHWIA